MSKKPDTNDGSEEDYDFSKGVRGKYIDRLKDCRPVSLTLTPDSDSETSRPPSAP